MFAAPVAAPAAFRPCRDPGTGGGGAAELRAAGDLHLRRGAPVGRGRPGAKPMLADWYSPSHIVHGFLFYALLHGVARRWPVERRFAIALIVETAWELIENTPLIIDRYREATIALGYSGDSILNSLSDIGMMALGFWGCAPLSLVGQRHRRAAAGAGPADRHSRQSGAQRVDAGRADRWVRAWQAS